MTVELAPVRPKDTATLYCIPDILPRVAVVVDALPHWSTLHTHLVVTTQLALESDRLPLPQTPF